MDDTQLLRAFVDRGDEAAFRRVSVSKWGGLEWPDGADLCPGMLRLWCEADEMASAGEAEALAWPSTKAGSGRGAAVYTNSRASKHSARPCALR